MHLAGNQKGTAVLSDWTGYLAAATASRQLARALRPLSYILIAGVFGVLLLVATATAPVLFGYHTYIVNGGSMEPALTRGSVAVTHPTSARALRVGDIIAYHHTPENPPVLHRIVEVTNDNGQLGFITQGDQNKTPDSQPVALQGPGDKVVYSVPYAGYVLSFAESDRGRFALIGVPLALLLVLFLRENRQSAKPRTERDVAFGAGEAPAALAELRTERAQEHGGVPLPAAPARPVASPFTTERAVDPLGDQVPAAPAPLARLRTKRAVDSGGDQVPAAPALPAFKAERAVDPPGDQVPAAPAPPVASPFTTERAVDSPGDQVPAAPAPPVARPFKTVRAVDSPGDQVAAAPASPVASPFKTERAVDPPGDQVAEAPALPVASPFQTERSQSDLPAFLVRQLPGRGPFEPKTQPAAAGSSGGPVPLRSPQSPEWPQRTTRRVA